MTVIFASKAVHQLCDQCYDVQYTNKKRKNDDLKWLSKKKGKTWNMTDIMLMNVLCIIGLISFQGLKTDSLREYFAWRAMIMIASNISMLLSNNMTGSSGWLQSMDFEKCFWFCRFDFLHLWDWIGLFSEMCFQMTEYFQIQFDATWVQPWLNCFKTWRPLAIKWVILQVISSCT